ncbi:hypothetical protein HWV62_3144 [Athelia sp. TMB]|nr:hypothetical protein HWV62_3144 [Athelia sp. TMB]
MRAEWQALHALAQLTSRILLANQLQTDHELKSDWEVVKGLAVLGMEERFKDAGREPDRDTWQKCFKLYASAFHTPKSSGDQKKLSRILKKPLDSELNDAFFEYNSFLSGLGRMSLSKPSENGFRLSR